SAGSSVWGSAALALGSQCDASRIRRLAFGDFSRGMVQRARGVQSNPSSRNPRWQTLTSSYNTRTPPQAFPFSRGVSMRSLSVAVVLFGVALLLPVPVTSGGEFKLEPGFTLIFNGKNLDGWREKGSKDTLEGKTEAFKGRFKVEKGI